MKIGRHLFANSVFTKVVIVFLITIIPMYALGIYIYNWGLHTVESEISKSTIAQMAFYLKGLESEIERMKILQYDCLNDEHLNKLAIRWEIMDNYSRVESMRQLQQRLITIKNSSNYIQNVCAHIVANSRTISSNTGVDALALDRFEHIRVANGMRGAQIIPYQNSFYLSTLQRNSLTGRNPLSMVEIELNKIAFAQALTQFNTYADSGSLLVNLADNHIIASEMDLASDPSNLIIPAIAMDNAAMEPFQYNGKPYYIAQVKSIYLNIMLVRYFPTQLIQSPLSNFYIWIWVFSICAFLIILVYSFSMYKFMHKPLRVLVKSFRKVENGDLQVSIQHDTKDEFGYLYERFNKMVINLRTLIDQVYHQKLLMQRAELKQLQSQINPHFLYNSFFMINTMARIGDESLVPFTKLLGEYFRFITRNASDFVALKDEVKHARAYAQIQQMRFPKRLKIEFPECPQECAEWNVPRLILQPIIENAFEHGVEKKNTQGVINILFITNEVQLHIIVEDNGTDMSDESIQRLSQALETEDNNTEITGLFNIHRRLRILYGAQGGLQVCRSDLGGLKVVFSIFALGGNKLVQIVDR